MAGTEYPLSQEEIMGAANLYAAVLFPGMAEHIELEYQDIPSDQLPEYYFIRTDRGVRTVLKDTYEKEGTSSILATEEGIHIFENQEHIPHKTASVNVKAKGGSKFSTISIPLDDKNNPIIGQTLKLDPLDPIGNSIRIYAAVLYPASNIEYDASGPAENFHYCLTDRGVRFITSTVYDVKGLAAIDEPGIMILAGTVEGPIQCRRVNLKVYDGENPGIETQIAVAVDAINPFVF
jgi:hypothetical protein